MKCSRCNKERGYPGRGVTLVKNGQIRGTQGMQKYDAVCNGCIVIVPIDDTTMKTQGKDDDLVFEEEAAAREMEADVRQAREPGCDDDLEIPTTEW